MSVYGKSIYTRNKLTNVVQQNNYNPVAEDIATYLDSVVFNEYLNYKYIIRESSFHDSVLEEKAELLLEISFKDIWSGIKKLIKKIVDTLKDIYRRIRDFVTNKKFKLIEKKYKDLESKIKDLEAENLKWKASSDSYKTSANKYYNDLNNVNMDFENKEKEYKSTIDSYKKDNDNLTTAMDIANKNMDEKDKTINNLTSVCEKISANDYLYFDMYDYFRKDIDPHRLVKSSTFSSIMNYFEDRAERKGAEKSFIWLSEDLAKFCVVKQEILNKFDKYISYDDRTMHSIIRDDIKNKPRYTDMKKLMTRLEWLSHGFQVSASLTIINEYQSILGKVEGYLKKYFPENNSVPDKLPLIVQSIKGYMSLIDINVKLISVMSNYAGRAVGAASSAILALSAVTGLSPDDYY